MRTSHILATAGAALLGVDAQHVHLQIPEVQEHVHSMLREFKEYTDYGGPSSTYWNHPSPRPHRPVFTAQESCDYWLADIKHQGLAAFNSNPSGYQVFRNVRDFGAKGDGVADDAPAINAAISSGGRCAPGSCASSTTTPAIVYFPPGTYNVNSSIIDYYYTQLIGNPKCLPVIRPFPLFQGGLGVIDADPYVAGGNLGFGSTNVFWRQIRNFIIDLTLVPHTSAITGIHWPTAQATSIQNVQFKMSSAPGTQHQGIFIESGSGGFMTDLTFDGGLNGAAFGNQQFTMRNFVFRNAVTAISQIWDWGWTYQGITIENCSVGLDMSSGGPDNQAVGSMTFIDSSISNTGVGIKTAFGPNSQPPAAGSLILENVDFNNVPIAVQGANGATDLQGNTHVTAWGQGHSYTPNGPNNFKGVIKPVNRPASLVQGNGRYYTRSKPQYEQHSLNEFVSARDYGATGDGHTDDTKALQRAITEAAAQNKILFLDHGDYIVRTTIRIPAGSRIVGETYSVILSQGSFFNNMDRPQPVVQIGTRGETGSVELSDFIVSTQGQQQGATLFEYNLISAASSPSGLWDVHGRVGGFAGSNLQYAQCPSTPGTTIDSGNLDRNCIAAFMGMHITELASGLYLENVWLWTADHDIEDPGLRQITIYAGRGLLDQSKAGTIWLYGTSSEHFTLYQYQFADGARNVFAGQVQTETPYYQPNPSAPLPFPYVASLSDPKFPSKTATDGSLVIPDANAWGLRIVDSSAIFVYGAGLYSFFNNYSTACSNQGNGEQCQNSIFDLENSKDITVYNLNTVGTHYMLEINDQVSAIYSQNLDGFVDTIALFRSN
ncbi:glycoside hydrolase family 55 protein [Hortaea werneckii]|nr:glycoside hydrolase family 55 protein [Hortaea werneckii]KAI7105196.1 glycoside hydrolase family 55 protein [Hortaea werneckii]KAI7244768.1 glycoside hydrolase family 55 protein [Hortaea werneckii]KAI7334916.1 glycoside hydrolase family 55 protein [Hortaea werneckii]KAI7406963.1 glycoside hydrolase family 55 protein [Hortaea werneckii]